MAQARGAVTSALTSVLLVASAWAFAQGSTPAAQTPAALPPTGSAITRLKIFTPFGGGGLSVGIAVTQRLSGSCFANSAATPARPDAWRCSAGNAILDPCFVDVRIDEMQLACAQDPFSADAALLTLQEALPQGMVTGEPDFRQLRPWALELENGQQCTLLTGATAGIAGMRINYGCADGAVVVGDVDRTSALWQVFYRTATRSIALEQVGVRTAWY